MIGTRVGKQCVGQRRGGGKPPRQSRLGCCPFEVLAQTRVDLFVAQKAAGSLRSND
ncbi:hypothetical protein MPC4_150083 [Methylocella tundrae]|uniref:Uncharacterized protein n=1 Tax=Methylocella tundrae TaxID=227605 RepID=A0A8B6M2P1_METTU|nr:hypothetical protein MPC4_150083 [Methylocella tundrae]